jgi:Rod binding domain-containing protein
MPIQPMLNPAAGQAAPFSTSQPGASKLDKVAADFESLLLSQMLRSARESAGAGPCGDDSEDSESNSSLVELGEQQFAQALAANGGLGIAKMVVAGLKNAD